MVLISPLSAEMFLETCIGFSSTSKQLLGNHTLIKSNCYHRIKRRDTPSMSRGHSLKETRAVNSKGVGTKKLRGDEQTDYAGESGIAVQVARCGREL